MKVKHLEFKMTVGNKVKIKSYQLIVLMLQ
jgi:hypothetical protein